ncbi:hypothetical protein [Selenomonas ruminantium]|uniref:hypothetical protein n=1 Tax=Selenomonas ruminantium TaxID=971 RepID=UPI0012D30102|nr:hypothetical protein [Selenomonas ruminantium]
MYWPIEAKPPQRSEWRQGHVLRAERQKRNIKLLADGAYFVERSDCFAGWRGV